MLIQGQVGPVTALDSSQATLRQGRTGEVIASQAHARYYEQTSRGNFFTLTLATTSSTVAAGNALNAGAGPAAAGSTQFALWNPVGSGYNLSLNKFIVAPISGTPTAGPIFHTLMIFGNPTITSAAVIAPANNLVGGRPPVARYLTSAAGATLTGGTVPVVLRPAAFTYSGAFSAAAGTQAVEFIEGDIVIPPGYGWVPCFTGVGTTFLNAFSVTWEEVPI